MSSRALRRMLVACGLCFLFGFPRPLFAQEQSGDDTAAPATTRPGVSAAMAAHLAAAPVARTVRIAEPIVLDGRLTEAAWADVPAVTQFRQTEPLDGAAPTERSEVRIIYDADAIYVGARLYDARGQVSTRLGRRDSDLPDSDWFIVVFDSYHDHVGGFRFRVNPAGVKGDEANGDRSWDPVWAVKTSVDSAGWTVEMRIPFSQLRFSQEARQIWGLQFIREIGSKNEKHIWSYTPRGERGGSARFGHLLGLDSLRQGRRLEILPYVAASAEYREIQRAAGVDFANPYRTGADHFQQYGLDLKYRPTSNLTLDATINPDFGQIEADEAQVNLSANETFFSERRPFFVEGAGTFRVGSGDQVFYSRRIGRAPQGTVPNASRYADIPTSTRILGAGKLTGRTMNGWTIGLMEAVTASEVAPYVDANEEHHRVEVEPRTNYFVGRVRRDLRQGQSAVGGVLTTVHRDLQEPRLEARLRGSAVVGGTDFRHEFGNRAWALSGAVTGSQVRGSNAAMIATQRSSLRYFHRPDADYVSVDSAATSLAGFRANASVNKQAGRNWRGWASASVVSPGFETNDLGFQNSADRGRIESQVEYHDEVPGARLRRWDVRVQSDASWNFGGTQIGRGVKVETGGQLLNYWNGRVVMDTDLPSWDDRLTRGGPMAWAPGRTRLNINVNSDGRRPYVFGAWFNSMRGWQGAWAATQGMRLSYRASARWSGDVEPRYGRSYGQAQYVTSVADPTATATFGRRYIFAPIEQTTLSTVLRLNATLKPTLSIQASAQPFLSSGRYGTLAELAAPRTYDFTTYGVDAGTIARDSTTGRFVVDPDGSGPAPSFTVADPNFNTRSMAATTALRWEWRPGSTLFLVWQQRRSLPANHGDFAFTRDRVALFQAQPENTLMVKASYWLNP